MSLLLNIRSIYNLKLIFEFTGEKRKLHLFKHNIKLQNRLDIHIYDFKKLFFTRNVPEVNKDNILDFYEYLKRKYKDSHTIYDIRNFFAKFFCDFLNEKKIDFELNSSHEASIDILLCENLKSIKLIIDLNDYKSSYKTESIEDKNKKPFLRLFQTIFHDKIIKKISEMIITVKDRKELNMDLQKNFFISSLLNNIYKFKPKIKTDCISLCKDLGYCTSELRNFKGEDKNAFKLWKLIVPFKGSEYYFDKNILKRIEFIVDLTKPLDIEKDFDLSLILNYKIKDYFAKINYKKLLDFEGELSNIKKLELIIEDEHIKIAEYQKKLDKIKGNLMNKKNNTNKIQEEEKKYNINNFKYIEYIYKLLICFEKLLNKQETHLGFLKILEESKFDDLTIIFKHYFENFSINKKEKSIEFDINYYEPNEIEFLNEIKKYEKVKLNIERAKKDSNLKDYNLFKYDEESKIKHFKLQINLGEYISKYYLDFPINFEKIITLDLKYTLVLGDNIYISFPLTEKNNKYHFPNLKNLKLYFCYDCEGCIDKSPKELIPNLISNLKFCPLLEKLDINYAVLEKKPEELYLILEGIKCLKYLQYLNISSNSEEKSIIDTNEFYKSYPEYMNYCPFLNNIIIEMPEYFKPEFLYEKDINYKANDTIINNYLYIETLGQKSFYSTYLCKNKDNKKVVIRKFKKSRINKSLDLFESEKYCLQKYKNEPNYINYIEFLTEEHFEYIVYEYIEDTLDKIKSKKICNKIIDILEKFYTASQKDSKIIMLPILPNNILIKKNFEVIIIGFGYINIYIDEKDEKGKLHKFYNRIKDYYEENFSLIPLSDTFNIYKYDIRNYYNFNNNWSYLLAKIRHNIIKIKNEVVIENELNIGKILVSKEYIFTLQEYSIVVYDRKKFGVITNFKFYEEKEKNQENEEEENESDEEFALNEDKDNSYNFTIINDKIILVLFRNKIYFITFINNKLNLKFYIDILASYKKRKIKNDIRQKVNFNEIAYIEKNDMVFISGKNAVSGWHLNIKKKKLTLIKFYNDLNSYSIFKLENNYNIPLISIGNEKLIFYKIDDKNDLIPIFDYFHNNKNWSFYENKKFIQNDDYCYILLLNSIMIIIINYEQNKVDCLFHCSLGRNELECIFPAFKGIFFGGYLNYLTKINGVYEIVKNGFDSKEDYVLDIFKDSNRLFIIMSKKIIEI